jgi:hypothetical protein
MRCDEAGQKLLDLMEDELPPGQRAEIAGHLEVCPACAGEFSAYRSLLALVQTDPVPEPSPRFWEDFLPSLKRRIEQEVSERRPTSASWLNGLRWWMAFPRPLIAGMAVAAISVLIVIRMPDFFSFKPEQQVGPAPVEQSTGREGEPRDWSLVSRIENGTRDLGEPFIVAGEAVEDPSILTAAVQQLPSVGEIADRVETAWVWRPESDPRDWLVSLSDEEQQFLIDRLRGFQWSPS